jgi:threonine dehydratase
MNGTVDDVLLVPDDAIVAAMRLLFAEAGLLIEPAGAAGVAGRSRQS